VSRTGWTKVLVGRCGGAQRRPCLATGFRLRSGCSWFRPSPEISWRALHMMRIDGPRAVRGPDSVRSPNNVVAGAGLEPECRLRKLT
jgi:hypothetical protein